MLSHWCHYSLANNKNIMSMFYVSYSIININIYIKGKWSRTWHSKSDLSNYLGWCSEAKGLWTEPMKALRHILFVWRFDTQPHTSCFPRNHRGPIRRSVQRHFGRANCRSQEILGKKPRGCKCAGKKKVRSADSWMSMKFSKEAIEFCSFSSSSLSILSDLPEWCPTSTPDPSSHAIKIFQDQHRNAWLSREWHFQASKHSIISCCLQKVCINPPDLIQQREHLVYSAAPNMAPRCCESSKSWAKSTVPAKSKEL